MVSPTRYTVAPYPRVAPTLGNAACSGMNTVAAMPEHLRGQRDALCVVAGAGRHHAQAR